VYRVYVYYVTCDEFLPCGAKNRRCGRGEMGVFSVNAAESVEFIPVCANLPIAAVDMMAIHLGKSEC